MAHANTAGNGGQHRDRHADRRLSTRPAGGIVARLTRLAMWPDLRSADRLRDQRNWSGAAKHYERVLKVARQADDVRIQLGHVYKESGRLDDAAGQYYDVLARTPDDDDLHLQIGHLEKLRLNWRQASHHYGEAVRLNADNAGAASEYRALGGGAALGAAVGEGAAIETGAAISLPVNAQGEPLVSNEVREIVRAIAPRAAPAR
jgi:tetratricopeptide (TPR) repeat protein